MAALASQEVPLTGEPESTDKPPQKTCAEWMELGKMEQALWACRDEFEASTASDPAIERMAHLEYEYGEPERAAELCSTLIDRQGWSEPLARARALAFWRAGDLVNAEELMRQTLAKTSSEMSFNDLITFLLTFSRWDEAAKTVHLANEKHPGQCGYFELGAVAEAGRSNDAEAVSLIKKAVDGGCPPYRWTTIGSFAEKKDQEPYLSLLVPTEIVDGLRQADDRECEMRFQLLRPVITPEVAPNVATEVLLRDKMEVRFEGLGLLSRLGSRAMESWKRLLDSEDFILRKYTLRRIREIGDPAFIPLVKAHTKRDETPGNAALTKLVLGELLLKAGQPTRAEKTLRSLPQDDVLFPVGLKALADDAETRGDIAGALALLEEAMAANPEIHVDRDRLVKLRRALEDQDPPADD